VSIAFWPFPARAASQQAGSVAKLTVDYPLPGSIFPPEITPPTFLWHDSSTASHWVIEVSVGRHGETLRVNAAGEFLQPGELDTRAGTTLEWTQEQQSTRTWKPDEKTWERIKQLSVQEPATIRITGYADGGVAQPLSTGSVTISTSPDPVGAPIFYRDVPLMIAPLVGPGAIQPLPPSALPLIKWELRDIAQPRSHTVMENLPTCANCHSFSRDGRTMGLDMDGPRNDKGLYAVVSISKDMTITNRDVLRWASFKEDAGALTFDPTVKRFGFMS
jgi:hypothetical protein